MEKYKKPIYKYCIVPMCKNTIRNSPAKLFFLVPRGADVRRKWCENMKRHMVSPSTCLYCCEDHFNIKEDTDNYVEYQIMTSQMKQKTTLRLKKGILPHKFDCQKDIEAQPPLTSQRFQKRKLEITDNAKKSAHTNISLQNVPVEFEKHKKNLAQGNYIKSNEQDGDKGQSVGNEMFLTDVTDIPSREFQYTIIGSHKDTPRLNTGQCRFCGEHNKALFDVHHVPYLNYTQTSLVMNHLSVKLDFSSDSLPKTVCFDCKDKLEDMRDFLILVKETQEKFKVETKRKDANGVKKDVDNNVSIFNDEETKSALKIETLIKVECESPTDEVNTEIDVPFEIDNEFKLKTESESDVDIKEDFLTIEETVVGTVGMNCIRKNEEISEWKNVNVNSVKKLDYDIDIKEELIEKDYTNDKLKLRNFPIFTSSNALRNVNCNSIGKMKDIERRRVKETGVIIKNP